MIRTKGARLPLHFLLRYSDRLRDVDTWAEHQALAARYGYVWWGKFGVGASPVVLEHALRQIAADVPTYVFLASAGRIAQRARLLDVRGGGAKDKYRAPELQKVPVYYREEHCSVWFKLADLEAATSVDRKRLVLFNDTSSKPQLSGMRGLVYVALSDWTPPNSAGVTSRRVIEGRTAEDMMDERVEQDELASSLSLRLGFPA